MDQDLSHEERQFISDYAGEYMGFRFPKGRPETVAMVESLEERGMIQRKLRHDGFIFFKLTKLGRQRMSGK